MRTSKSLAVFCFDLLFFAFGAGLLFASLATPAFAYVDPSVMTYTIQALAGVAVALSAVIGVAWRRLRRVVLKFLKVDESAGKTVETRVSEVDATSHPDYAMSAPTTLREPTGGAFDGAPLTWPKRFGIALLAMAFFMFTLFVAPSFELVDGNTDSLFFTIRDVWALLVGSAFVIGSVIALAISCARGKAYDVLVAIVFALGVAGFVQALLLNGGLPVADGREVAWASFSSKMIIGVIVWTTLVAVAVAVVVRAPALGRLSLASVAVVLILVQGISIARPIKHAVFGTPSDYMVTKAGLFEVSGKSNVVVFCIDTVDTQEFDCVLEQYPDTLEGYEGFTYFRNSVGSMIPTAYGVPFLVSGQMLQGGEDYQHYIDTRFTRSSFVSDMRAQNYSVSLYADCLYSDKQIVGDQTVNIKSSSDRRVDAFGTVSILYKVALYRNAPWVAKPMFWYYTDDMNQAVLGGSASGTGPESDASSPYVLDDGAYYRELCERGLTVSEDTESDGAFKFIHLNGAHVPFTYDEEMNQPEGGTDMVRQTRGTFTILQRYFDELKRLGAYDDTTIIVTADHGYWNSGIHGSPVNKRADGLTNPVSPICLVKPAGATGPLKVSEAPVSHIDFQPTVLQAMGGDGSAYGEGTTYFDIPENADRPRYFVDEIYDGVQETQMNEWVINGDALDFSNWSLTGKVWMQGDL